MSTQSIISEKIPPILTRILASTYVLYYSSQAAHWNVEGPEFVSLHALFKDSYDDAATAIDDIAERIRQLNVKIMDDLPSLLSQSAVEFDPELKYVARLHKLHEKLETQWNSIASVAEAAEDAATVDMAGKRAGIHGKFCWMLKSLMQPKNY